MMVVIINVHESCNFSAIFSQIFQKMLKKVNALFRLWILQFQEILSETVFKMFSKIIHLVSTIVAVKKKFTPMLYNIFWKIYALSCLQILQFQEIFSQRRTKFLIIYLSHRCKIYLAIYSCTFMLFNTLLKRGLHPQRNPLCDAKSCQYWKWEKT